MKLGIQGCRSLGQVFPEIYVYIQWCNRIFIYFLKSFPCPRNTFVRLRTRDCFAITVLALSPFPFNPFLVHYATGYSENSLKRNFKEPKIISYLEMFKYVCDIN